MWGIGETINSMTSYQLWDIAIKIATTIVTTGAAYWAYIKYRNEKNRQYYEKRLTNVYGPLYGFLTACLTVDSVEHVTSDGKTKLIIPASIHGIKIPGEIHYSSSGLDNILAGETVLTEIAEHIGYARPQLVELFYQYKFFMQIRAMIDDDIYKDKREELN